MTQSKDNKISNIDFGSNLTIAEGSDVVLDAYDFVKSDLPIDKKTSFDWSQLSGPRVINLINEKTQRPAFRAPYLEKRDFTADLKFSLTIRNNNNETIKHPVTVTVKRVHRALILQGAVSLGAYEFG